LWCGPILRNSINTIIFRIRRWFSEKPILSLKYRVDCLHIWKNYWVSSTLWDDLAFRDFCSRNFPSFSVERITWKYFGELFLDLTEFYTSKEIGYLLIFLEFQKWRFQLILPFKNLWSLSCRILKFLQWGVNILFAWPEMNYFTWYYALMLEISCFDF